VIAVVTVAVFCLGVAFHLFARLDGWFEARFPRSEATPVGLLVILFLSSTTLAVLRWRQARLEQALRLESDLRYRTLVEQVPAVTYTWDPTAPVGEVPPLYVSPQLEQMLGYTPEQWSTDPAFWIERIHPEDRERVLAASEIADRDGTLFQEEYRMVASDGRVRWVRDEARTVESDGDGRPLQAQGVMYDITEQKETELRLHEAEGRYRTLVEQVPVVVYVDAVDDLSTATYISPQYERLTGYSAERRIAEPELWVSMLHPEDRDRVLEESVRTNTTGDPFDIEYRIVRADGAVVWVHDHAFLVHGPDGVLAWQGVLTDITERRLVQEALGRRERILEAAGYAAERFLKEETWSGSIGDVLERLGRAGEVAHAFVYRNDRLEDGTLAALLECEWSDPDRGDVGGHPAEAGFALRMRQFEGWEELLQGGEVIHGSLVGQALICAPITVEGTWWGSIGFDRTAVRDWQAAEIDAVRVAASTLGAAISREHVARRLSEAEARFRTLVEQMPAITYLDERREGSEIWPTIYISPQVQDILGYTPEEWHADPKRWEQLVHPDDAERARTADIAHYINGEPLDIEIRVFTRSGDIRWIRDQAVVIRNEDGRRVWSQGILTDVTESKLAEQQLHEAEARYRGLIETIPAATYIDTVDAISEAIYMSPQVKQIYGYTPEEWRADPCLWEEGLHPDDRADVVAKVERHNREGVPYEAEYRFRHRDGRWVWVHDEAVMIPLEEGGGRVSQGVIYDITPQKQQEEQLRDAEERYRAIVEHVPSVIYLDKVGPPMASLYVSPVIEQMMGVTSEEWLADPDLWLDLTHPDEREEIAEGYFGAAEAHQPWSAEYRILTRDGRTIWVHDETTFLHDEAGKPKFIQGVISDITERKVAEQALRESEQREREAAERLRALDDMKNTFLAAVSHELRSPLTSILGLSLTLERAPGMETEDREDLLRRLAANARKLDRLLKDLLDIDRLSRGIVSPQYRTIDLGALARRTIENLEPLADRAIVADVAPLILTADPAKIERILENLLMNAVRHTTSDRTIWLRIQPADGGALISVEDEGPGVPRELREAIFEPFRQGPTASSHSPGTGIGLSLVARFAELHGGRAWVEDREGGGASFRVFIPDRSGVESSAGPEPPQDQSLLDRATTA
jgi:PAS domain S-box-containing protein